MKSLALIAWISLVCMLPPSTAMEGQVFIVTEGGTNVKLGLVMVSIHHRKDVEDYILARKMVETPVVQRLDAEADRLVRAERHAEAFIVMKKALSHFHTFFEAFDRQKAIVKTKTDADGKFRLEVPKDKDMVLVAFARRAVGDKVEAYHWVLPPGEWEEPMFLSNDNKFSFAFDLRPELLTGNLQKANAFRRQKLNQKK